jgi:glycerophosphoryl diester phosphodiesterase
MPAPLVIAHRGDSSRALENSFAAVRLALSIPVDMIEIDIRMSRDNGLYLMHDKDTGRTADRKMNIEQSRSDEIAQVRLNNSEAVPSLTEILRLVSGKAGLNMEIKSDDAGALCAGLILQTGYRGLVLISSFKGKEVFEARRVNPGLLTSQIFDSFSPAEVNEYKAKGYRVISLRGKTVHRELVEACHEKEIKVFVWTLDREKEIEKFIAMGVDGIYSNRPVLLKRLVAAYPKQSSPIMPRES